MKNLPITIAAVAFMMVSAISCNQSSNKAEENIVNDSPSVSETQMPSETNEKDSSTGINDSVTSVTTKVTATETVKKFSIAPIVANYLTLKNALVADNDKVAASEGKKLLATLNRIDLKSIPADKNSEYMEIAGSAKDHAKHIRDNAGNIEHQREHLVTLSEDVKDLVAMFGTSQKLYLSHCPMFNYGKGAMWLSETKTIKNPYYGAQMLSCGEVQKTIDNN